LCFYLDRSDFEHSHSFIDCLIFVCSLTFLVFKYLFIQKKVSGVEKGSSRLYAFKFAIFAILKFSLKYLFCETNGYKLFIIKIDIIVYTIDIIVGQISSASWRKKNRINLVRELSRFIPMTTDDTFYSICRYSISHSERVTASRCVPSFAIAKALIRKERLTAGSSAGRSGCLPSITRKKRAGLFRVNADHPVILTLHKLNRLRIKLLKSNRRSWTCPANIFRKLRYYCKRFVCFFFLFINLKHDVSCISDTRDLWRR